TLELVKRSDSAYRFAQRFEHCRVHRRGNADQGFFRDSEFRRLDCAAVVPGRVIDEGGVASVANILDDDRNLGYQLGIESDAPFADTSKHFREALCLMTMDDFNHKSSWRWPLQDY